MKENKSILKVTLYIGFLFAAFLVVVLGLLFLGLVLTKKKNQVSNTKEFDDGKYISKFENPEEYQCFGTCFCDEQQQNERRTSTVLVKKGLKYLVAASSTVIAYQLAKNHFQVDCKQKISRECPDDSIRSEVSHCEATVVSNWKKDNIVELDKNDKALDFEDDTVANFFCKGYCVHDVTDSSIFSIVENFCTGKQISAIIKVYQTGSSGYSFIDYEHAREKFRAVYLVDLCHQDYKFKDSPDFEEYVNIQFSKSKESGLDIAHYRRLFNFERIICSSGHKDLDENIQCRKATPEEVKNQVKN